MAVSRIRKYVLTLSIFFLLISPVTFGQTNHLSTKLSLNIKQQSFEYVLVQLSQEGDFNFSYNAEIFNFDSIVSIKVKHKSVEKILNELSNNQLIYKVVGNHIILLQNPKKLNTKRNNSSSYGSGYVVSGYISDANTGHPIVSATVYEVEGKFYANTNSNGFYTLLLPSDRALKGLNYCKYGYLDTIILVHTTQSINIDISLRPRQKELQKIQTKTTVLEHDIHSRNLVAWLVPPEAVETSDNLNIYDGSLVQVSILPNIGSNRFIGGSMTNRFSLNILAGYTGSVKGAEVGSLVNIVRNDVEGFQLAGFGNIVGKDVTGAQVAGFFNVTTGKVTGSQVAGFQNTLHGEMHGFQLSGFNNLTTQNVDGVQLTGFVNVALKDVNKAQISGFANYGRMVDGLQLTGFSNFATQDVKKVQLSGFSNYCRNVEGVQITGFANVASGNVNAAQISAFTNVTNNINGVQLTGFANMALNKVNTAQIAGFANYADSLDGIQISGFANAALAHNEGAQVTGFVNIAGSVDGVQLAGFTNIATKDVKGVQISAFFNRAKKLNGYQFALVNIVDTVEKGAPIGLISIVKKGTKQIEIAADEVFISNVALKMGTPKFYNIFQVGFDQEKMHYTLGAGLNVLKSKHINFPLELSYTNMWQYENVKQIGELIRFKPNVEYLFTSKFSAFIAPSLNILITVKSEDPNKVSYEPPYSFASRETTNNIIDLWVGGQIGLRYYF